MPSPVVSLPLLGMAVTLGNLAVWVGLACALACVAFYWAAMLRTMRLHPPAPVGAARVPAGEGAAAGPAEGAAAARGNGKPRGGAAAPTPEELRTARLRNWGRRFFFLTALCAVVGSAALWYCILTQQYTVNYVHKNTNGGLPFGFRFAAFWSDQEGTFFLWALYNSILGAVLLWKAREDEGWVMPFFTLINVSLFSLLTFMNPFWLTDPNEVRKGLEGVGVDPAQLAFLPSTTWEHVSYYFGWARYLNPQLIEGRGLNEQLQNFWMVIHPPTLFVGYSSLIIPAAFALGALMRRNYDGWVPRVFPWLLFSWAVLGTGLFLGAYWAYETLGWGGYWSWDPVENASIVPWFVATALLHGLVAQRNRGNYKHANLFLGVMAGCSVLLGSFLVRSGVLSETSVHSFASPQQSVFNILLGVLVAWFVGSVGLWCWRYREIDSEIAYEQVWERHFGFFLGMITLCVSGLLIVVGVTLPIWIPLILGRKITPEHTFYNIALLPVTFIAVMLMALTPLMPWKQSRSEGEAPRPLRPFHRVVLGLAAAIGLAFLATGVWAWTGGFVHRNDPAYLVFGLGLALALVTNAVCLRRASRGGLLHVGPWLAHIGFVVMLGGIIISTRFKEVHSFRKVEPDTPVQVLGREFIWRGQRRAEGPTDRDRMLIDMKMPDGRVVELAPKLFISKVSGQTMAWPQIVNEWFGGAWGDVYVEPTGVDTTGKIALQDVPKDTPQELRIQYRNEDEEQVGYLTFVGLEMGEMQKVLQSGNRNQPFTLYAQVRLALEGRETEHRLGLRVHPTADGGGEMKPIPLRLEGLRQGTGYSLQFTDLEPNPGNPRATFEVVPDVPLMQGYFQVLHVPGIQVVWYGIYLLLAGGFIAWRRRAVLARRTVPAAVPQRERPVRRPPVAEPAGAE